MKVFVNVLSRGLALLGVSLMVVACSSSPTEEQVAEKAVTEKAAQEPVAQSPQQILERAAEQFSSAPGLTAEQKTKLAEVYSRVYIESMGLRREMGQNKSLLFTTLSKPNYKPSEIKVLKSKIVQLDQKRLNLMFEALDDVEKIVGKGNKVPEVYKHFERFEIPDTNYR
jgi:hypothetical protein